ncbi:MAG: methyltransferase or Fe-S oxidoreductase [Myxococcaceae bacterium]|nr:methyltransferase or Fe-S oxidoreductase [Myxococcaceae bacterium]
MEKLGDGPVRCLLVRPEFLENTFYNPRDVFRLLGGVSAAPPLGLLTVAAHLPRHWELKFVDGDVEPVTDAHLDWAQLLLLSGKGPQEIPIRQLVERAHQRNVTVIVGGAGPTLQPSFYEGLADYVVAGEVEPVLPKLLADLANGVSAGLYRSHESASLLGAPVPRYDLVNLNNYSFVGMNFSRGCPFNCEFCAQIEIFGRKPRTKTVDCILREHQQLFDLGYDVKATEEVLTAMRDWNRNHGHPFCYSTEATMNLAKLPKILELMRDNDFRYVFMGIESGDDAVLSLTQKGQNTKLAPEEVVKTLNAYGMVVNTGLILGFDGEGDETAATMLEMVRKTGVFPTLVLPLHALPNTQLARRLAKEGRLFGGGIQIADEGRTDTATTGLNFVTFRPRAKVIADLADVLEALYQPKNHYARVELTTRQLKTAHKFRPPLRKLLTMATKLPEIVRMLGMDKETAYYFWRAIGRAALKNPGALEMVIALSVMNNNYARASKSYVTALRAQLVHLEQVGEQEYNRSMGATDSANPVRPEQARASA